MAVLAVSFTVGTVLPSCSQQDQQNTIISQETAIDKYLSSTYKDSVVIRRNGSNRVTLKHSTSKDSLEFGDTLHLYYAGFIFNNGPSDIFATNWPSVAEKYGFELTDMDTDVLEVQYTEDTFVQGLNDGLYGMRAGEEAEIVFSAKYGFGNTSVCTVPPLSALLYRVLIININKLK